MKATSVPGYRCAVCRSIYPHTKSGKERADACCLCQRCKKKQALYTGIGYLCRGCDVDADIERTKSLIKTNMEIVEKQQLELLRLESIKGKRK